MGRPVAAGGLDGGRAEAESKGGEEHRHGDGWAAAQDADAVRARVTIHADRASEIHRCVQVGTYDEVA